MTVSVEWLVVCVPLCIPAALCGSTVAYRILTIIQQHTTQFCTTHTSSWNHYTRIRGAQDDVHVCVHWVRNVRGAQLDTGSHTNNFCVTRNNKHMCTAVEQRHHWHAIE